ncbi:GNAT family N-acetyltransferase [Rhodocytophaga rosea]|uniref:GNAT family N-acetyltransferase n=1 Tax=Rhodocytophaga rosea TaxID=2704465 RepID=A0A6C0GB98_9BACT|nr:GNAT family N-acetyltransferase [Rhodocytophaga rosea]QHT65239.1 GNAT family N-acetyltransferase [Rhodocytophaga rosea]
MTFTFYDDKPEEFLTILREVGQWLTASNKEMWQLDTLTAENLFDEYTLGNCFVMYVDQIPAATFILQWKDPLYYSDVPDNTAGFIHKVAIRRKFAGQGIFAHILDFCRKQCLKRNIYQIQLETDATRPSLMRFYEQYSFQPTYRKVIHEFGQTFTCQYYKLQL